MLGLNETNEPLRLLETVNHLAGLPKRERRRSQGLFTWDYLEAGQNHREIDIEVSQWGDPASKNMQFAIQPTMSLQTSSDSFPLRCA